MPLKIISKRASCGLPTAGGPAKGGAETRAPGGAVVRVQQSQGHGQGGCLGRRKWLEGCVGIVEGDLVGYMATGKSHLINNLLIFI